MSALYDELTALYGTSINLEAPPLQVQAELLRLQYGSDAAAAKATGIPRSTLGFWRRGQRLDPTPKNRALMSRAMRGVESAKRPAPPATIMGASQIVLYGASARVSSDTSDRRSMTITGVPRDVRAEVAEGLRKAWVDGDGPGFPAAVRDALQPAVTHYLPSMTLLDVPTGIGPRYGTGRVGTAVQFGGPEPDQAQPWRARQ